MSAATAYSKAEPAPRNAAESANHAARKVVDQANKPTSSSGFSKFSNGVAHAMGKPVTFALAILIIVVWALTGPIFHYSDTWQLIINTGTTIVTFLMVFLIQNTQNRDTEALQLKIDELIRVTEQARNRLIDLEDLTEEEMDKVKQELTSIARTDRDNPDTPA